MKLVLKTIYRSLAIFLSLVMLLTSGMFAPFTQKVEAAAFSCGTYGILYQYPGGTNTVAHHINLDTGADSVAGTVNNRTINAIGYNVVDDFLYGWDHTQESLVQIQNDHTATNLTITGYSHVGGHQIIIGDVDNNGHYWFINSSNNNWYQVDLTTSPPSLITSGSAAGISGSAGADWAYVPGTNSLYRTMETASGVNLWAFNRTTKAWSNLGQLTDGSSGNPFSVAADRIIGANYADVDGYLYASSNSTGKIWRINVNTVTASLLSTGPSSSSNDGAHCIEASIVTSNPVVSSPSSSSPGSSNPNPPTCTAQAPSNAPNLFQINRAGTSATLYFSPVLGASYYYIAYGYTPGDQRFGVQYNGNSTGVISYTINGLSPNTQYYFQVRSGNGCAPGPWGNTMSTITNNVGDAVSDLPLPPNTGFGRLSD